ncbi:hypothetical protein Pan44_43440 [Caulifigura coniformis]|uniref:Uncharacterized protein n=1 Tax=Caulifigura coniformis TaxID=2527983 RepID=A0A517SJJ0_9PLAN|nr:hypothetical protein [Caulifigura coniformis]QDT56291.1 hypothetical protein Pan44_43440 [Caulifigura coniformis]
MLHSGLRARTRFPWVPVDFRPLMTACAIVLVVTTAWTRAADTNAPAAESTTLDRCELYPLAVGTQWIFQSGPLIVREKVTAHEEMQGELCARIDTLYEDRVVSFEHLAVRSDGVYRVAVSGKPVEPPLKFLSLPPQAGAKWSVASKVADKMIRGDFVASEGQFHVRSSNGDRDQTFKTHRVTGENFQAAGESVSMSYDFVPQFGKVRQTARTAGLETTMELKDFHEPGQTPTRTARGGSNLLR